mmetsp:Transcript_1161/g.3651  ORF Transcript_1161/g.3651 Transcript_1161/m.3651 type:complete len:234 (+) Transcript_1161:407-1108(+)
MSEKTRRSGTSSGLSLSRTTTSRMRSRALAKLVDPPQGACLAATAFSRMEAHAERSTQVGLLSKVRKRSRKAGCVSSDTRMPRATATSMGRPAMDPDTSTRATTLPMSTPLAAALPAAAAASGPASSAASSARRLAASASWLRTLSRRDRHWASSTSASRVDTCPPEWPLTLATTSWGWSAAPLSLEALPSAAISRRRLRAETRSSSSGWRLPVSSWARSTRPFTLSLRKAFR